MKVSPYRYYERVSESRRFATLWIRSSGWRLCYQRMG